jgi:hypothetical protein
MPSPRPLTRRRKPARDTRAQLEPTTPGPVCHEPGARRAHCAKASMPNPPWSPPPAATGSHDRHNSAERRQGSAPAFPSSLRVPGVVVVQRFSTALTNQTATQSRTDKSPSRKSLDAVIIPKRRRPLIIQPERAHRARHHGQPPAPTRDSGMYPPRIASAAPPNRTPQTSTPSTPTHRECDWDRAETTQPATTPQDPTASRHHLSPLLRRLPTPINQSRACQTSIGSRCSSRCRPADSNQRSRVLLSLSSHALTSTR